MFTTVARPNAINTLEPIHLDFYSDSSPAFVSWARIDPRFAGFGSTVCFACRSAVRCCIISRDSSASFIWKFKSEAGKSIGMFLLNCFVQINLLVLLLNNAIFTSMCLAMFLSN